MKREEPPKQKTQPKKGKPVEIPVPTRDAVLRDLEKAARVAGKKPLGRSEQP